MEPTKKEQAKILLAVGVGLLALVLFSFFPTIPFGKNEGLVAATKEVSKIDSLSSAKLLEVGGEVTEILNLNEQIKSLSDEGAESGGVFLEKRNDLLEEVLQNTPPLFISLAKDSSVPEKTFSRAAIQVFQHDDWQNPQKTKKEYFVVADGDRLPLEPVFGGADLAANFSSKRSVNLKQAFLFDGVVVARLDEDNLEELEPVPVPETLGNQRTLVILADFLDSGPRPFTPEEINQRIFTGPFQQFYQEQSYGKISFSGQAAGWWTIPRNGVDGGVCRAPVLGFGGELDSFIASNNINLSNYDRLLVLTNHNCVTGSNSSLGKTVLVVNGQEFNLSVSYVGSLALHNNSYGPIGFAPFKYLDFILSHEMGHALGLSHANGWDCGSQSVYGSCQHVEYGNFFDTMGSNAFALHFNAFYKEKLHWFGANDGLSIGASGRYTLNSLEGITGKRFAKIQTLGSPTEIPYYLEFRRGQGFDIGLQSPDLVYNQAGLILNQIIRPSVGGEFARVFDLKPSTLSWFQDLKQASLNGGTKNYFIDSGRGITLGPIINTSESAITFNVALQPPSCVRAAPHISGEQFSSVITPGDNGFYYLLLTNNDSVGCGASSFNLQLVVPSDWTVQATTNNFSLNPGESRYLFLGFIAPRQSPLGINEIMLTITNSTSGLVTNQSQQIEVVPPPVIASIEPASGGVGALVRIVGSGFSLTSNSISFSGVGAMHQIGVVSVDGNTLEFVFPDDFLVFDCNCLETPPAGDYSLRVSSNGAHSNPVTFTLIE